MDAKRIILNGAGIILGGGLMYLAVRKSGPSRNRTISTTLVEGSAIFGGASLGYFLSNLAAAKLFGETQELLPQEQANELPSGEEPVETPSATTAMGNVAAKAKAINSVTPVATPADIAGGNVVDITKNQGTH